MEAWLQNPLVTCVSIRSIIRFRYPLKPKYPACVLNIAGACPEHDVTLEERGPAWPALEHVWTGTRVTQLPQLLHHPRACAVVTIGEMVCITLAISLSLAGSDRSEAELVPLDRDLASLMIIPHHWHGEVT